MGFKTPLKLSQRGSTKVGNLDHKLIARDLLCKSAEKKIGAKFALQVISAEFQILALIENSLFFKTCTPVSIYYILFQDYVQNAISKLNCQ